MGKTIFTTAFLSQFNHEKPTLEIHGTTPSKYAEIIISNASGEVIVPEGFDEVGRPYVSDEFYQELKTEYDNIVNYDKEKARNLFCFKIKFVI